MIIVAEMLQYTRKNRGQVAKDVSSLLAVKNITDIRIVKTPEGIYVYSGKQGYTLSASEVSHHITKKQSFAEDVARNLRCSGVTSARVVEIVAYEVVISSENNGKKAI